MEKPHFSMVFHGFDSFRSTQPTMLRCYNQFLLKLTLMVRLGGKSAEIPKQKPPAKTPHLSGDESVYLFLGFTINFMKPHRMHNYSNAKFYRAL